jgi:hypothetical protein
MLIKEALANVGGLSEPSKMPCFGYSIPADTCNIGSKLRKVPNSICSTCYALKGNYRYPKVKSALYNRLDTLNNRSLWIESMVFLINKRKMNHFRWHDSGDLQSPDHFKMIIEVCKQTPETKHWLPTRESKIVIDAIKRAGSWFKLVIPDNLTIRLSAMSFDKKAPENTARKYGLQVSGASKLTSGTCPAWKQGGECKDCRNCWDKSVFNVVYKAH